MSRKRNRFNLIDDCESFSPAKVNTFGVIFYVLLSLLSLGIFALVLSWTRKLKFLIRYKLCSLKDTPSHIIVDTEDGVTILCEIQAEEIGNEARRFIEFRFVKYFWEEKDEAFIRPQFLQKSSNIDIIKSTPLTGTEVSARRRLAGDNTLDTPITPVIDVLVEEILGGFNIYQLVACIVWIFRDYAIYACMIIFFMIVTIIMDLYENRKSQLRLRAIAEVKGRVTVIRETSNSPANLTGTELRETDIKHLVPGDHVIIKPEMKAPCDLIVIKGECLVNEAVLTGESVPVSKSKLQETHDIFDLLDSNSEKNIIYCGSTILRESECIGFVANVGFSTLKGQITRNILYPKREVFKHEKETYRFLFVLLALSLILMSVYYTYAIFFVDAPHSVPEVLFRGLDIIFTSLPPGLPLCLLVGISFAVKKLDKRQITCL